MHPDRLNEGQHTTGSQNLPTGILSPTLVVVRAICSAEASWWRSATFPVNISSAIAPAMQNNYQTLQWRRHMLNRPG